MKKFFQKISYYTSIATVFLIPFYFLRFSLLGIRTNILEIAVLFLFLLTLISGVWRESEGMKKTKKFYLPAALLIAAFIASLYSDDKIKALGIFKGWFLVPMVMAWVISINFNVKKLYHLIWPTYFSLMIVSIWAFLQKYGLVLLFYGQNQTDFSKYIIEGRAFGFFESPNYLAMFIVPMLFLSFNLLDIQKYISSKIIFSISFLIPLLALYFTDSRAGIIAFVAGFFIYLNYRFVNLQKAKDRQPIYSGLVISGLAGINIVYLYYATKIFTPVEASNDLRVKIYHYALELLKNHPIGGIGLGDFQNKIAVLAADNPPFLEFGLPYALHPHNLFMAIWLNLSIVGLCLFIWLLVSFIKNAFSSDSYLRASIIAGLAAILIHGLFDTTYFKNDLSAIFWLMFAFSLVIKDYAEEK